MRFFFSHEKLLLENVNSALILRYQFLPKPIDTHAKRNLYLNYTLHLKQCYILHSCYKTRVPFLSFRLIIVVDCGLVQ